MQFSPEDVETKRFLVALRGYDKEQVESFLRDVASDYREALREAEMARQKGAATARAEADPFAELGEHVASILRRATEVAEEVRAEAEKAAEEIRAAAATESARAMQAAQRELEAARQARAAAQQELQAILQGEQVKSILAKAAQDGDQMRAAAEREAAQVRATLADEVLRAAEVVRKDLEAASQIRRDAERAAGGRGAAPGRAGLE